MIHVVMVTLGAAAGSTGFIVAWQRRWDWRTMLVFNAAVCAVAGAVAGGLYFASPGNPLHSLVSYGLLATAAPFVSTLLPPSPPRNVSEAWRFLRRTAALISVNALLGATAASATYMLIVGSFFFVRGTS